MSFDELDKKIRDAADMHQPSYKEDAWANMEDLLDKHLPQKKNNYRRYFFWFIAFLVSTSLIMIWLNRDTLSTITLTPIENSQDNEKSVSSNQPEENKYGKNTLDNERINPLENNPGSFTEEDIQTSVKNDDLINRFTNKSSSLFEDQYGNSTTINLITRQENTLIQSLNDPFNSRLLLDKVPMIKNDFDQTSLFNNYSNSLDVPIPAPLPTLENHVSGRKSFLQNISFTASAGPTVSSVSSINPGRMTTLYGAGIKYAVNNRWSLGTGFFVNKKVYAAGKDDYRPPANFWNYYTNLLSVDADCDVFEIPLTISYSIKKRGKHEWIASTGISNYIMKKETYNYIYKNNAGQIQSREWSIENNNLHHFSALTLSAGYKHQLNNRTSILIEPNVKIPLKGVGYGKVKFYNAGTLITLQVNPFTKK